MTASTLQGVPPVPARSPALSPSPDSSAAARVSRFRLSVLLGAALFAPAAFLVLRGNLSVTDALLRFGCALLVAAAGTALVLATVPRETVSEVSAAGETPTGAAAQEAAAPAPATAPAPASPSAQG